MLVSVRGGGVAVVLDGVVGFAVVDAERDAVGGRVVEEELGPPVPVGPEPPGVIEPPGVVELPEAPVAVEVLGEVARDPELPVPVSLPLPAEHPARAPAARVPAATTVAIRRPSVVIDPSPLLPVA